MRDIDPEDIERTPGFLPKSNREYLLDEGNVTNPEDKRNQVKKRTRHAIADLVLLKEYADEDLKQELVRSNTDPAVFTGVETNQLNQTGTFLLEVITDEESAKIMKQVMQNEDFIEGVEAGLSNDLSATLRQIVSQVQQLPISKQEAHAAIEEYW